MLGLGGVLLLWLCIPVARSAWQAQYADPVANKLRLNYQTSLDEVVMGIEALDRAVASDPTAGRRFQRSELLMAAALSPFFTPTTEQRADWLRFAEADLVAGLAVDPGRGLQWLRLASVRLALGGPSQQSIAPLMMSIDTAAMLEWIWPVRLQLILDNWQALTPAQRDKVAVYVAQTWQLSTDRRWFASAIRSPVDELFVRYFLRNEPGAQDEITRLLAERKK